MKSILGFGSALLLLGCGASIWREAELRQKATFELSCSADHIELTPLDQGALGAYRSVGVSGCDRRASYVVLGGEWVMNTLDGKPEHTAAK